MFFGRVHHTGDVVGGSSYTETLTAPLPGVTPGDYHLLVRSDIRNHIPESDETNNLAHRWIKLPSTSNCLHSTRPRRARSVRVIPCSTRWNSRPVRRSDCSWTVIQTRPYSTFISARESCRLAASSTRQPPNRFRPIRRSSFLSRSREHTTPFCMERASPENCRIRSLLSRSRFQFCRLTQETSETSAPSRSR